MQEGADAPAGLNMKQAAAELWGTQAWKQRSLKPEAASDWQRRCMAAGQLPKAALLGSSGSRSTRCLKAGEPEGALRAGNSRPAAEKPDSPYKSVVSPVAYLITVLCMLRLRPSQLCMGLIQVHGDCLLCDKGFLLFQERTLIQQGGTVFGCN